MNVRASSSWFLSTLLAAAAMSQSACGASSSSTVVDAGTDGSTLDTGPLEAPITCTNGAAEIYEALRTALQLDYLERRRQAYGDPEPDAAPPVSTEIAVGEPCAGASDRTACQDQLAALRTSNQRSLFPQRGEILQLSYLVCTRGDEARAILDVTELRAWLGTIDAPAKAWMIANQAGYDAQCSEPWIRRDGDSFLLRTRLLLSDCPVQYAEVLLRVKADGSHEEVQRVTLPETGACAGRRPDGWQATLPPQTSARATYFAHVAALEAASVQAFETLRRELLAHGAPTPLVAAAEQAIADEVRHAARVSSLARGFGAVGASDEALEGSPASASTLRDLFAIALENAREGCVREAYGALEAAWLAQFSDSALVRETFTDIAADEARHAALAWELASWIERRLTPVQRERVRAERHTAERELRRELEARLDQASIVGVPSRAQALDLLDRLSQMLGDATHAPWARAA